jgi:hypothetical protein
MDVDMHISALTARVINASSVDVRRIQLDDFIAGPLPVKHAVLGRAENHQRQNRKRKNA